jgi:hypothetical protein
MNETPSQSVIAKKSVTVKDARGRSIEVRKLNTLDRMQLLEVVGSINSANEQYMGYAGLVYSVASIDGNPTGRLGTKLALEGVAKELDDDGFEAVAKAISENFVPKQRSDAEVKESVKNV